MRHHLIAAVILAVAWAGPAPADAPKGFEGLEPILVTIDVVPVEAPLPVLANPSATVPARDYAAVIARARAFFERELGWSMPLRMLVLERRDWEQVTGVPYPAPHVWNSQRLILMPASLAEYPGFGVWGFDDGDLNAILTVHEIGHALADDHGLRWEGMSRSMHELVANLMMAAFIHAEAPHMERLLEGVPAGFAPTRPLSLQDFDYSYIGLGLQDYAWFQFVIARAAGFLTTEMAIKPLMDRMSTAFADTQGRLASANIAALEGLVPGTARLLEQVSGPSHNPQGQLVACTGHVPVLWGDKTSGLIIENRSGGMLRLHDPLGEAEREDTARVLVEKFGLPPDPPAAPKPVELPDGFGWSMAVAPDQEIVIEGRGCALSHDGLRLVVVRE